MGATATRERAGKPAPADTDIHLWSQYAEHKVVLRNEVWEERPGGRTVRVDPGRKIKFKRGLAKIPQEWLSDLMDAPAFTGSSEPRSVYLLDEAKGFPATEHGVQVVSGPQSAIRTHAPDPPPLPEWQVMSPSEVAEAIHGGHVADLMGAMSWEAKHRGNEIVMRMLATAIAGQDVKGDDPFVEAPGVEAGEAPTPGAIPEEQRAV